MSTKEVKANALVSTWISSFFSHFSSFRCDQRRWDHSDQQFPHQRSGFREIQSLFKSNTDRLNPSFIQVRLSRILLWFSMNISRLNQTINNAAIQIPKEIDRFSQSNLKHMQRIIFELIQTEKSYVQVSVTCHPPPHDPIVVPRIYNACWNNMLNRCDVIRLFYHRTPSKHFPTVSNRSTNYRMHFSKICNRIY